MKEETLSSALLLVFANAFVIMVIIYFLVFVVECVKKYIDTKEERRYRYKAGMETNESRPQAVHVLINNRPVWLDLGNLIDTELAMRNEATGEYKTESGEQHFTWDNAMAAAKKQGKRLLTNDERNFIASLPRRWDNKEKGMWFTFDLVDGGTVDVFFLAGGRRYSSSGSVAYVGSHGYYWSASPDSSSYCIPVLNFGYSGYVRTIVNAGRACGFSVRCVRSENK